MDLTGDIWVKSTRFHGWNPPDFKGEIQLDFKGEIPPPLHSSNWRVFTETLAFIIWVDFTGEIWVKSARFHGWNPPDFRVNFMKSLVIAPTLHSSKLKSFCWNTCFYNFGWIWQVISGWNPPDFMGEIHQISGWNPLDFKGEIPHPAFIKLKSFYWNTCFYNLGGFHRWNLGEIHQISWVKSTRFQGEFHEILGHSPHPAFIKLKSFCWNTCFYNFGWIWQVISGWNPPDFTGEIRRISRVKSAGFHGFHEIRRISWWNPPDFMNVSFCVMIKYRSFYRKTKHKRSVTMLKARLHAHLPSTSPKAAVPQSRLRASVLIISQKN